MDRDRASRARQQLRQAEEARAKHLEDLLRADVMIVGSFVTLGRRCGKPTCHCAQGDKHYGKFISRSEGGRTRLIYVPGGEEVDVATKADRYRSFRQARADLMKLANQTAELADTLQQALTEPYPPPTRARPTRARKATRHGRGR